jgi:hypothetical protein
MESRVTGVLGKSAYTVILGRLLFGGLLLVALLFASACTAIPSHVSESDSIYQWRLAANSYSHHCSEQTGPLKNEAPLCRSVPIVTVPIR